MANIRYNREELNQLLEKAKIHYPVDKSVLCKYLYRNKPECYFDLITSEKPSIMRTYVKDNSGDPRCPINGEINGLFFTASVNYGSQDGAPIPKSPFGKKRLIVPIERLFNVHACNIYFSDFYCMTIEVFYTEDINIDEFEEHWFEDVGTIGQGSSTPGGLQKRPNCSICNLR
ncbi:hypothetical protein HELRODRAFT_171297 [Helobdella robusta]|uniref:Phytanoyl-CoA hydroxylase-interacting protein-like C-terminal domain-containing protein n=1 Tax=Helobdella robusta TaxID=6412 RepID=T1F418_HELRO|nr:hypothetical protein HELRODRAFT_171297 [Helobdella robusta]ESO05638.1 hypothetical protein HELRODRAFT_171297 [Helobdella robusta]